MSTLFVADPTPVDGGTDVTFTVMLSNPTGLTSGTVTVDFSTVDGSALADTNYTARYGSLTFNFNDGSGIAKNLSQTITVPTIHQANDAEDKVFGLQLSDAAGADIVRRSQTAPSFAIRRR